VARIPDFGILWPWQRCQSDADQLFSPFGRREAAFAIGLWRSVTARWKAHKKFFPTSYSRPLYLIPIGSYMFPNLAPWEKGQYIATLTPGPIKWKIATAHCNSSLDAQQLGDSKYRIKQLRFADSFFATTL
jgi:hypothetical protein